MKCCHSMLRLMTWGDQVAMLMIGGGLVGFLEALSFLYAIFFMVMKRRQRREQ